MERSAKCVVCFFALVFHPSFPFFGPDSEMEGSGAAQPDSAKDGIQKTGVPLCGYARFSIGDIFAYFTKAAKSLFVAYLANSRSMAASLAMALSAAIAAFRLLITPLESFVRAATIAFR